MRKILIEGMVCSRCTDKIEEKLRSIDGVEEVKIFLEEEEAYILGAVDEQLLKSAIESEGYKVISIEKVQDIEHSIKHSDEKKGFFSRLLKKIEDSNQDTFGAGKIDCCDLEKKEKKKK
jgi:copper chaperone CopZ